MTAKNYVATNRSFKMQLMTINSFHTKNSFSYSWRVKKWEHERSDNVIFKEKQLDEEHLVGLLLVVVATILTHLADVIIRVKWSVECSESGLRGLSLWCFVCKTQVAQSSCLQSLSKVSLFWSVNSFCECLAQVICVTPINVDISSGDRSKEPEKEPSQSKI